MDLLGRFGDPLVLRRQRRTLAASEPVNHPFGPGAGYAILDAVVLRLTAARQMHRPGELWFGKIERDLLARGIFTSLPDLARKIQRYITRYNDDPKPIRWTYSNPAHRITLIQLLESTSRSQSRSIANLVMTVCRSALVDRSTTRRTLRERLRGHQERQRKRNGHRNERAPSE